MRYVFSDSNSGSGWSPLYGGGAHLDQDAIQYIHKFYCKDCRMEEEKAKAEAAASGNSSPAQGSQGSPGSSETGEKPKSPQSMLEEMSLQQSMDKNRECKKILYCRGSDAIFENNENIVLQGLRHNFNIGVASKAYIHTCLIFENNENIGDACQQLVRQSRTMPHHATPVSTPMYCDSQLVINVQL